MGHAPLPPGQVHLTQVSARISQLPARKHMLYLWFNAWFGDLEKEMQHISCPRATRRAEVHRHSREP